MYQDNTGLQHENYAAACRYYGADDPAALAEEARHYKEEAEREERERAETIHGEAAKYAYWEAVPSWADREDRAGRDPIPF